MQTAHRMTVFGIKNSKAKESLVESMNVVYVKVPKSASSTAGGVTRRTAAHHDLSGVFTKRDWIADMGEPGIWADHGKHQKAERVAVSIAEVQQSRQTNNISQWGLPSWQTVEYIMVGHHKGGSTMFKEVNARTELACPDCATLQNHEDVMGNAVDESMMQTPNPACFLHQARNPFEMLVSGYLYNLAGAEEILWANVTFAEAAELTSAGCEPMLIGGRMTGICKGDWGDPFLQMERYVANMGKDSTLWTIAKGGNYFRYFYRRGVAQVFNSTRSGPLSARLPDANANETYREYLSRVDLDAALLAESVFASDVEFSTTRFSWDYMKSQSCAVNVCYDEFSEDCNATWERVLQTWNMTEPHYSATLKAISPSCPGTSQLAEQHSVSTLIDNNNITTPSLNDMVMRARELDRDFLNGTMAELETYLGCKVTSKYTDPDQYGE